MNTAPCEKSVIDEFKTRLDLEIREECWDAADHTRVAAKRRLLEMVRQNCITDEFAAVRDALADSSAHLRFSNPEQDDRKSGGLTSRDMWERLVVDAETADILAEQAPVSEDTGSLGNIIMESTLDGYKTRLGIEIREKSWDAVDQTRVAVKRRLLDMAYQNSPREEIVALRNVLSESYTHSHLSEFGQDDRKSGNLTKRDLTERLLVDAETAAILTELAPVLKDVKSLGNEIIDCIKDDPKRKWTAGELGIELNRSCEEISFVLSRLRAEEKIVSLQMGREVKHWLHSGVLEDNPKSDRKQENENEYSPM